PDGAHDLTVICAGREDPALVVFGFDKAATRVVGAALVAPHLLDVHRIPEAIHRFLLLIGLRQPHLVSHGPMLTATAAQCRFATLYLTPRKKLHHCWRRTGYFTWCIVRGRSPLLVAPRVRKHGD